MICDVREIVLTPFPFVDMAVRKFRPALVLSEASINSEIETTVLVMITGAKASHWPTDVVVQDWRSAGLKAPSFIRSKIFTLDNRLISHRLGALSETDRAAVRKMLQRLIVL